MAEFRITDEVDDDAVAELRERVISFNLAATGLPNGRSIGCAVDPAGWVSPVSTEFP